MGVRIDEGAGSRIVCIYGMVGNSHSGKVMMRDI